MTEKKVLPYDPEYETVLHMFDYGDRSVGIDGGCMTVILNFSESFLREDKQFAEDLKGDMTVIYNRYMQFPATDVCYDFEIRDDIALQAEQQVGGRRMTNRRAIKSLRPDDGDRRSKADRRERQDPPPAMGWV
jgi:hypothetical protein